MFFKFARYAVLTVIIFGAYGASFSDVSKKKTSNIIKFTGTIIDNKSLKEHADSLPGFLSHLQKDVVHDNVRSGYSLYSTDGKIYKLAFETVEAIWNDLRTPRGGSTIHTLKISGNARKLGADTLKIIDFVEVK